MRCYATDMEAQAYFDGKLALVNRLRAECNKLALEIAQEADKSVMSIEFKVAVVLAAGHKIYAIKLYREATGKSLVEAKEYVESINW